jgi:Lar family restriction alleviation protein
MELKPCPFCGGEAKLHYWRDEPKRLNPAVIRCKKCGVETPVYNKIRLAEEAWNRRVGEGEKE